MAGKGKVAKAKKKQKHRKQGQKEKADGFPDNNFDEIQVGNAEKNEELGRGESSGGCPDSNSEEMQVENAEDIEELGPGVRINRDNRRELENVYLILAGIRITTSDHPTYVPSYVGAVFPVHVSAEESAYLKGVMEQRLMNTPVHTPACGHPNIPRDIDDCGNNMCWAIAAMKCLSWNLQIKGGSNEMIELNCKRLLECYKEEKTGYPYILEKAFKYIKEHHVRMEEYFYPKLPKLDANFDKSSEEVEALRLSGFEMVDHKNENAIILALRNGPVIAGVRESPEFTMLGNKIYRGSDNELVVDGKYCNHALMVMRHGKKRGTNVWKVRNSEGLGWGDRSNEGMVACDSSLPEHRKHLLTTIMYPIFE